MFTPAPSVRVAELLAEGEALDAFPRVGTVERDPEKIRETLGALIRHGAHSELTQGERKMRIRPLLYSPKLGIAQWELGEGKLEKGACTIALLGYNALFRFSVDQLIAVDGKLTTPEPAELYRVRQRWQRRKEVKNLTVLCTLPGGKEVSCRVRDISYGGMAIYLTSAELLLEGENVEIALAQDREEIVHLKAEVVEVSTQDEGGLCRLRIPSLRGKRHGWVNLVNDHLHPGTRTGSEYGESVWELYRECGYFHLSGRTPADFALLKTSYESVVEQLDAAPQLGCQVVWPNAPEQGGVNAALSMLKVYEHSWFGFQMARVSGAAADGTSGRKILREIHFRAYEHAQQDPDLRWLIGYTQVKKVWSRMVHHDLAERYVDSGGASITRFHALQYEVNSFVQRIPKTDAIVDRPSGEEVHELAMTIASSRDPAYCDALDLMPERLTMSGIRKQFARTRMMRDRSVLVVRVEGKTKAAAIVETGADGLHVFGLLDLVRLYPMDEDGPRYFGDLLRGCAQWFQKKSKKSFCLFLEESQVLDLETKEMATDLGLADMVILSAEKLPEFFEYLLEKTSPRPQSLEVSEASS